MKKLILPVALAVVGTGGGAAAGLFLLPPPVAGVAAAAVCADPEGGHDPTVLPPAESYDTPSIFVPLNNQFIVPVIAGEEVASLVILSVSLEVPEGSDEVVHSAEPRLRDAFLQVLFDHANTGGFEGTFTATETMRSLRLALDTAARDVLGDLARRVLIVDIVRQDV